MNKLNCLATALTIPALAMGTIVISGDRTLAANSVKVSCDTSTSVPTIVATLSSQGQSEVQAERRSQTSSILSFLPKYFDRESAVAQCQKTATSLDSYYSQGTMNYLASDTVNGKPVVCAVQRRGVRCNSYSSDILFSLEKTVNPIELLYDMLGENFKGSQPPSSRTVSRIYTDLRPNWWPF